MAFPPILSFCAEGLDSKMSDIPTPLLTEILKRLPAKSLLRFKCVSKSWKSIIDDPYFINLHLKHSNQTLTHQTLILRSSYLYPIDLYTLEQSLQIDQPLAIDHPLKTPSCGTELLGSCNGLLCLSNGDDEGDQGTIIYNPLTKMHKKLPYTPIEWPADDYFTFVDRRVYGFGYDQVHDDYKLVRIIQFDGRDPDFYDNEVKVYSLKSHSWSRVCGFPREYYMSYKRAWGVYLHGCLHWMVTRKPESDGSKLIVGFELGSGQCKVIPQPRYLGSDYDDDGFHLNVGVLQGCLYVMCNYPGVQTDVWVMKEYGVEESWTKEFTVAQQPEVMDEFEYVKPLAYSRDGSKVLLEQDLEGLAWFDLRSQSVDRLNVHGMPRIGEGEMMVESLVPLDNQTTKQRKKKPIKKRDDLNGFLSKGFKLKL